MYQLTIFDFLGESKKDKLLREIEYQQKMGTKIFYKLPKGWIILNHGWLTPDGMKWIHNNKHGDEFDYGLLLDDLSKYYVN